MTTPFSNKSSAIVFHEKIDTMVAKVSAYGVQRGVLIMLKSTCLGMDTHLMMSEVNALQVSPNKYHIILDQHTHK